MADDEQQQQDDAADAPEAAEETTEVPAVETEAPAVPAAEPSPARTSDSASTGSSRPWYGDRRGLLIGAGGAVVLVVVFLLGMGVASHHDDGDERFHAMRGERTFDGPRGGDGMRGGGNGPFGGGGRGERGGPFGGERQGGGRGMMQGGRGGHGGAGVVTQASDDELTIEPLAGRIDELVVSIDDDTEVKRSGEDGPRDIEDAEVSDIDEGDIVMVLGTPGDPTESGDSDGDVTSSSIDARAIVILRDGDE